FFSRTPLSPASALFPSTTLFRSITYGRAADAIRVFTGVPFGAVGGVAALWLRDLPFSISAAVGFIALSGVAVLGDMVLVSRVMEDRKSTRLNSSHVKSSYAVFCL